MEKKKQFVFLVWESDELGVFLTPEYFQLLMNFHFALEKAHTWGEFWGSFDSSTQDFLSLFMQYDQFEPKNSDLISEISDEMFIFGSQEFPVTQCAEQTTTAHGSLFPSNHLLRCLRTEYGESIDVYSAKDISGLLEETTEAGLDVEVIHSLIPFEIYDY